jgi:hypothetical protein
VWSSANGHTRVPNPNMSVQRSTSPKRAAGAAVTTADDAEPEQPPPFLQRSSDLAAAAAAAEQLKRAGAAASSAMHGLDTDDDDVTDKHDSSANGDATPLSRLEAAARAGRGNAAALPVTAKLLVEAREGVLLGALC